MREKVRVVAATVHQKTNEVEIIIEKPAFLDNVNGKDSLHSIWIDCEHELAKLKEEINHAD